MSRLRVRRPDLKDIAAIAAVLAVAAVLAWLLHLATVERVQGGQIRALSVALDAQRGQAQRAGLPPVAPPPGKILASPQIVLWCETGRWRVRYTDGRTVDAGLCTGPPGPPGVPGPAGSPGLNGTDGRNGLNGTAGRPPAGWTYRDALGGSHSCSRDGTSPDSAPRYTCG